MQRLVSGFAIPACAIALLSASPADGAEVSGTVQVAGKPAQWAVVWLEVTNSRAVKAATRETLDQRNLSFSPHVLAVRVGTAVDFPNNDRVFHNVFSFRDGTKFNLGMYPAGTSKRVVFDTPGVSRVFCDIHPNMAAYIVAVDTPYYAVSDEGGAFTISGVPAGTYTYHAWRAGAQPLAGSVTVDAGRVLEIRWP
jgi:plastocyanin